MLFLRSNIYNRNDVVNVCPTWYVDQLFYDLIFVRNDNKKLSRVFLKEEKNNNKCPNT